MYPPPSLPIFSFLALSKSLGQYIIQTFSFAAPNLSINGFPVDPADFFFPSSSSRSKKKKAAAEKVQYEPFDSRKRYRIEDLAREEEDLLRSIAALKRRVPAAAAAQFAATVKAGAAADEAALEVARVRVEAEGAASGSKALEGMGPLDRQDDVERQFAKVVEALGRLKREMPATVAKMERARVAAGYVATER